VKQGIGLVIMAGGDGTIDIVSPLTGPQPLLATANGLFG
jgi:predicted polyphosphate/ATP-dependent NAD kinase